ncbi:TPA: hypothetical protein VG521_001653 [Streptococcus pyogenes]|nr:hypothetical protein [Streptococcus pyogenes]
MFKLKRISNRMFLVGSLVVFIFGFIILNCSVNNVYAQCEECEVDFGNEDYALKQAAKYITVDEYGRKTINVVGAKQSNEDKYIVRILEIAEQIQKDEGFSEEILNNYSVDAEAHAYSNLSRYGHYCGKGNDGWDKTPIDDLDRACKVHDRCYVWGGNNTQCNATFCSSLNKIIANNSETTYKGAYARSARLIFCWF